MDIDIVQSAKEFMLQCTRVNKAPAWELTEIAIQYGLMFAELYKLDVNKILVALYLAHCVFSNVRGCEIMKNHTTLSAQKARERLKEHEVSGDDIDDICKAIELHHTTTDSGDIFCEVVKNAESFKFLTYKGLFVFMHHLGERGLTYEDAKEYALYKAKQKQTYLTIPLAQELSKEFIESYEKNI